MNKSLYQIVSVSLLLALAAGCSNDKMLPLEQSFSKIVIGQSDSAEVLALMPESGVLQTAESISVLTKDGWCKEAGMVTFAETDSLAQRKTYLQRRTNQLLLLTAESLDLTIQTVVPVELLEEPYETDTRKYLAILEYCHESMIADAEPFIEDKPTESLVALARSALGLAILNIKENIRFGSELISETGYLFDHVTLGKCSVLLSQDSEDIFTLIINAHDTVDMFNSW